MSAKERDLMKRWVAFHLKAHPEDYWLRIPDGMYGNFKPADGILFCGRSTWMLEFKVDRRKTFRWSMSELPEHQRRELKGFVNKGRGRLSAVIVCHLAAQKWYVFPTNADSDTAILAVSLIAGQEDSSSVIPSLGREDA